MSLFLNGVETNTVMLNGVDTTGVWNGEVVWGVPPFKTLTLYHSEGGTLTANELTGYPGDTINLSTAYNTYWRFSGYQWTGDGTLANNTYTFGNEDATICACYKVNAFTATGGFDKGSNVTVYAQGSATTANDKHAYVNKYALHGSHTGDIPASWYSTSNRWNPSNASAYSISINAKMNVLASGIGVSNKQGHSYTTAVSLIGNTQTQSQTFDKVFNESQVVKTTHVYNKTFTTTTQATYSISAHLRSTSKKYCRVNTVYMASGTTGTWTATGIAP